MNDGGLENQKSQDTPILVSVIIPVLDHVDELGVDELGVDELRRCLRQLSRQTYPAELIEIIVIDIGSAETVTPLKPEFPGVKWVFEPNRSSYVARNQGIVLASGALLAFTGADCSPAEDWVANGVNQLRRPGAPGIIAGKIELDFPRPELRSTREWYQQVLALTEEDRIRSGEYATTANLMVDAEVFKAIGVFDGRFEINGDQYWAQSAVRAGYSIAFAHDVFVRRPARQTLGELLAAARLQARESLIQDSKINSSRGRIVWKSLYLFLPDLRQVLRMMPRREGLPLVKVPGVFFLSWMMRIVSGKERILAGARDFLLRVKRAARVIIPHPKAWAIVSGNRVPVAYITGGKSRLDRPESIAFSPSGQLLGVSNSEGHSVSFYAVMDTNGKTWSSTLDRMISNAACLNFVHDAVMSPCGTYIASVARDAHTLTVFGQPGAGAGKNGKDSTPCWSLKGEESGLNLPTGVAIHPSGDFIAVANRVLHGITLYRKSDHAGNFETAPFQSITEEDSYCFGLSSPHGLDFSPDGTFLTVAHKRFRKWGDVGGGQSGLAIYRWRQTPVPGLDPVPVVVRTYGNAELHSVSVHPSGDLIALSDEGMGVEILRYSSENRTLSTVESFPVFRIGSSVKGVGFTRDGKQFAVTCDMDEILFFETPADPSQAPTSAHA